MEDLNKVKQKHFKLKYELKNLQYKLRYLENMKSQKIDELIVLEEELENINNDKLNLREELKSKKEAKPKTIKECIQIYIVFAIVFYLAAVFSGFLTGHFAVCFQTVLPLCGYLACIEGVIGSIWFLKNQIQQKNIESDLLDLYEDIKFLKEEITNTKSDIFMYDIKLSLEDKKYKTIETEMKSLLCYIENNSNNKEIEIIEPNSNNLTNNNDKAKVNYKRKK